MKAKQIVLSRGLPKTGQITEYSVGDDGTHEAGWWIGRLNATNKTRFIAKTIDGDDVVIDRATGLMWAANGNLAGCRNGGKDNFGAQISYANSLTFAEFSDWRMPNLKELLSIIDYSQSSPAIDASFFPNTSYYSYWTSTSSIDISTSAFSIEGDVGDIILLSKSTDCRLRCVRGGV